jgi:hypothetical protein
MTDQSFQPPLPPSGWTLLARGEQENDVIARCPGGHVHLDYGNLTLRFLRDEFLAFAHMVTEAAMRLEGNPPKLVDHRIVTKPPGLFSLN